MWIFQFICRHANAACIFLCNVSRHWHPRHIPTTHINPSQRRWRRLFIYVNYANYNLERGPSQCCQLAMREKTVFNRMESEKSGNARKLESASSRNIVDSAVNLNPLWSDSSGTKMGLCPGKQNSVSEKYKPFFYYQFAIVAKPNSNISIAYLFVFFLPLFKTPHRDRLVKKLFKSQYTHTQRRQQPTKQVTTTENTLC